MAITITPENTPTEENTPKSLIARINHPDRVAVETTAEHCTFWYEARIVRDDNPDTSYLDQTDQADGIDFSARKRQYKRGKFYFCGVIVKQYQEEEEVRSCSLWGIESDSGADYFRNVANELIAELHQESI